MSAGRSLSLAAFAVFLGAASVQAQAVKPDTVIVAAFALVQGTPYVLKNTLLGKAPSHFRVSGTATFKGATWIPWPSSNLPTWDGAGGASGACGVNTIKLVGHFQVRAVKTFGAGGEGVASFVNSNVARDTLCIPFG